MRVAARMPRHCFQPRRFGDLKMFDPKTMCPIIAVRAREAILHAAKDQFEAHGWAATTVAAVAADAAVSPKTIQALFGTKAALLAAAVDYAIAGDVAAVPAIARESARSVESAPDTATMLDRHASHVAAINARSAPGAGLWRARPAAASWSPAYGIR